MFELEHTELSEKVYHLLKKMILNREFAGGQRLDMNELSSRMKISRTPLKDAVKRLVTEGLVEIKPRSGTFVATVTSSDIKQVMELRLMMEEWCISRLTKDKAAALGEQLTEIIRQSKLVLDREPFSFQEYLDYDLQFHDQIIRSADNPRMLAQYHSLNNFLHAMRIFYFRSFERSTVGYEEHMSVIEAIRLFDLELAKLKLREHIVGSTNCMLDIIDQSGGAL